MYLIDTDVLLALRIPDRNPEVVGWVSAQRAADLYLSVVTVGEIERGIARERARSPGFADRLGGWLDNLVRLYSERILPVDTSVARRWGHLTGRHGRGSADLFIAATALEHGLTIVTRNVRHFEPTGVAVLDPSAHP
jgi:predicted nucleic acid-binding protein